MSTGRKILLAVVGIALAVPGCGLFEKIDDIKEQVNEIQCGVLAPKQDAAKPGETVEIGTIPTNLDGPIGDVGLDDIGVSDTGVLGSLPAGRRPGETVKVEVEPKGDGEGVETLTWRRKVEGGEKWSFLVPVHPNGIEGGEVSLKIKSGELSCSNYSFQIQALEPKPELFEAFRNTKAELLEAAAEKDKSPDAEWNLDGAFDPETGEFDERLPAPTKPLAVAHYLWTESELIDEIANNDALREAKGLIGAVMQQTQHVERLKSTLEAVENMDLPEPEWKLAGSSSGPGGQSTSEKRMVIRSAKKLDRVMRERAKGCESLWRSTLSEVNTWSSMALTAATIGSSGGVGALITVIDLSSSYFMSSQAAQWKSQCVLRPNTLTKLHARPDRVLIEREDEPSHPIKFENVAVTAQSGVWNAGEKEAISFLSLAGGYFAGKAGSKVTSKLGAPELVNELMEVPRSKVLGDLSGEAVKAAAKADAETLVELRNKLPGGSEKVVGPFKWTVEVPTSNEWLTLHAEKNPYVKVKGSTFTLEPTKGGGPAPMVFQTDQSKFAGSLAATEISARVARIQVRFQPRVVCVDPTENPDPIEFRATVSNAKDPGLKWTTDRGEMLGRTNTETATLTYEPPGAESAFPVVVSAKSTADTGARQEKYNPPPRKGTARLQTESAKLELRPKILACVEPQTESEFRAEAIVCDRTPDGVEYNWQWSANSGDVEQISTDEQPLQGTRTATAKFTAPSRTGKTKVSVAIEKGGETIERKSADVTVRQQCCEKSDAQLHAGGHTCNVLPDGSLECWGAAMPAILDPLDGASWDELRSIPGGLKDYGRANSIGAAFIEAREGGSVMRGCLGLAGGRHSCTVEIPEGNFRQFSFAGSFVKGCAIDAGCGATCFGSTHAGEGDPPGKKFRDITIGGAASDLGACGVTSGGKLECWGCEVTCSEVAGTTSCENPCTTVEGDSASGISRPTVQPPSGEFVQVERNARATCAIRTDRDVVCWGADVTGKEGNQKAERQSQEIDGNFVDIDVSNWCGVEADGGVKCWELFEEGASVESVGAKRYEEIEWPCGRTVNGVVECVPSGGGRCGNEICAPPGARCHYRHTPVGVCKNQSRDGFGSCARPKRYESTEQSCDGYDNDCDGKKGEDVTKECGQSTGRCEKGEQKCNAGTWSSCQGNVEPRAERCGNGVDDDCDGATDENC